LLTVASITQDDIHVNPVYRKCRGKVVISGFRKPWNFNVGEITNYEPKRILKY
tara:strand:- start:123 stop:281 length:159 start_codon:yes stop_codon:yes gene_type:complete